MNIIETLLKVTDYLNPAISKAQDGMVGSIVKGNLLSSAITSAFDIAGNAVTSFVGKVQEGIESQQSMVMTVGSMATVMDSTYNQAESLVAKLQSRLANAAATLPGDTEGYVSFFRQISDDVGAINKEMNGGVFNVKEYEDQIVSLTSKFQILADQPGLTATQGTNAFQQILGGTKVEDLQKFEFFKANPSFLNALNALVKEQGKNLDEMTKPERYKTLIAALDRSVTDETIEKLSKTLGGQLASLKSTWLDPTTGVFGFTRDLNLQLEGQQTVISALTESASALFGDKDSLFSQLGILFQTLGLTADPMQFLYDGIQQFNKQIKKISNIVLLINSGLQTGESQTRIISDLQRRLGSMLQDFTNNLADNIEEGIPLVVKLVKDIIVGAVAVVNFADANIDQNEILAAIGRGLFKAVQENFQPKDIGLYLQLFVANIGRSLMNTTPVLAYRFVDYLRVSITNFGINLVSGYVKNFDSVLLGFTTSVSELSNAVPIWFNVVKQSIHNVILDMQNGVLSMLYKLGDGIKTVFQKLVEFLPNLLRNTANFLPGVAPLVNAVTQATAPQPSFNAGLSRYEGQIPNAASGILGGIINAVMRESIAKPPGSQIVIANSSEAILNRSQQANLGRAINGATRVVRGNLNIGNINFPQSNSQMSPDQMVEYVMGTINQKWGDFERNTLSNLAF